MTEKKVLLLAIRTALHQAQGADLSRVPPRKRAQVLDRALALLRELRHLPVEGPKAKA